MLRVLAAEVLGPPGKSAREPVVRGTVAGPVSWKPEVVGCYDWSSAHVTRARRVAVRIIHGAPPREDHPWPPRRGPQAHVGRLHRALEEAGLADLPVHRLLAALPP